MNSVDDVREREIARYVAQVRQALTDLPPQVRDELLEDLPEHLTEVAAEADGALADRLGPPEAYAAELRAAAGLRQPVTGRNLDQRIATAVAEVRARLRAVDAKAGPLIGYARASEYLRLLRPVWWVVRGYLVAMLITVMLTGQPFGLLPRIGGSTLAAGLLLAATVLASIWVGRRTDALRPRFRLVLHGAALVLVLFGLVGLVDADQRARNDYISYEHTYGDPYSGIQDVYVYDSEGRLIEGAILFDQNGQPIRLGYPWCPEAQLAEQSGEPVRRAYPYCPQEAPFRLRTPLLTPAPAPASSDPAPSDPAPTTPPSDSTPSDPASTTPPSPGDASTVTPAGTPDPTPTG